MSLTEKIALIIYCLDFLENAGILPVLSWKFYGI